MKIETSETKVKVYSPFNREFINEAKKLNGKWDGSAWVFDPRDEQRVRDICKDIYGYGYSVDNAVTVQVKYSRINEQALWRFGRKILERGARDWNVKLGDNVVIVSGSFGSSGGSRRYPVIGASVGDDPVVLEIRNVPRPMVDNDGGEYEIVGEQEESKDQRFTEFSDEELLVELRSRGYDV